MRLTLAVLVLCVSLAVAWDNSWDEPLNKECFYGTSFVRVASIHDNGKEDRQFQFECGGRNVATSHQCYWTGYVNQFDGPMNFRCHENFVVTGVSSYHDDDTEDRRFNFKCCQMKKYRQKDCHSTAYINYWDDPMDYRVPRDSVIRGFYSYHRDDKEDRRWKVHICRFQ